MLKKKIERINFQSGQKTDFLDVTISLTEGVIENELYVKPKDNHHY